MPPAYDNIANALALTQDGASHTISLDCRGATFENDEATNGEGWEGVWVKIDLSGYVGLVTITLELLQTAADPGFAPYMDTLKVVDASFDPTAPVFAKLGFPGKSVGDGTTNPSTSFTLNGGTGSSSGTHSINGIFYLIFTDFNFVAYGAADLTYTVPLAPICVGAAEINPDSPTASVVSGRVREAATLYFTDEVTPILQQQAALKFTWSGPAGMYQVAASGRYVHVGAGAFSTGHPRVLVAVNGRPFHPIVGKGAVGTTGTDISWTQYPGLTGGTYDGPNDGNESAPWVPLSPGDQVEVFILPYAVSDTVPRTAGNMDNPFDLSTVCFTLDSAAPASSYSAPQYAFPQLPLGETQWGSPNQWGGQWLIPDGIYTDYGVTRYNEPSSPWGIVELDYDFIPLEDGTVYAAVNQSFDTGSGTSPLRRHYYLALKKITPGGAWTEIAVLNAIAPSNKHPIDAVSMETDGTYIYIAWWELDTFSSPKQLWKWHLKRLDPSTDTITELGTGQHAFGNTTSNSNYDFSTLASAIAVSGNGDVFVCTTETTDDANNSRRPIAWRWNGSAWSNLSLPTPSIQIHPLWSVIGENGYWDRLSGIVCAREGEGVVTDGFTLAYCYYDGDAFGAGERRLVTIPYTVGSGWGTEILSEAGSVESGRLSNNVGPPPDTFWTWIDLDLLWSDLLGHLVLVTDFLGGGSSQEIWDVLVMSSGQWAPLESFAPASIAGNWNQGRNTAAIGPGGEIYACRASSMSGLGAIHGDAFFTPMVFAHTPGFDCNYAQVGVPFMGEAVTPHVWMPYIFGTAHNRIRFAGNTPYVMTNLDPQELTDDFKGFTGSEGTGLYVFKLGTVKRRMIMRYA